VLALLFHSDLLTSPFARFEKMYQIGNYLHPFLWSGILYGLIAIVRLFIKGIQMLKRKKD
jgi:heme exporter protein D